MNQVKWFVEEVHPHEPFLRSYLRGSFPTVRDVDDVVQESYCRLIKTRERRDVSSARAFLFRIARNFAIDFLRRERRSPVQAVADLASIHVIDDLVTSAELLTREEKSHHLGEALASLPVARSSCCTKSKGFLKVVLPASSGFPRRPSPIRSAGECDDASTT